MVDKGESESNLRKVKVITVECCKWDDIIIMILTGFCTVGELHEQIAI